jgi:hypothetical protein
MTTRRLPIRAEIELNMLIMELRDEREFNCVRNKRDVPVSVHVSRRVIADNPGSEK